MKCKLNIQENNTNTSGNMCWNWVTVGQISHEVLKLIKIYICY